MGRTGVAEDRHHSFAAASLEEVTAHGGARPILTRRVVGRTDSLNFIDLTVVPSGSDIGVHTHADDNEEIYVVVSGNATMRVDGRTIAANSRYRYDNGTWLLDSAASISNSKTWRRYEQKGSFSLRAPVAASIVASSSPASNAAVEPAAGSRPSCSSTSSRFSVVRVVLPNRPLSAAPAPVQGDYPAWLDHALFEAFGEGRVVEAQEGDAVAPLDIDTGHGLKGGGRGSRWQCRRSPARCRRQGWR